MKHALLAVALLLIGTAAHADTPPPLRMSLEIDPADYAVYDGYGAFIGFHPRATGAWRFRIGGGKATMPDFVTQNSDNNDGWTQTINPVITVAAHRYFGHARGGFFMGAIGGWSSLTFTAPSGGKVDVSNVFAGLDLGYRWFPSKRIGLVITPHLGAIVPIYKSTEPEVGMEHYDLLPVIPLPQLLIGYEFDVVK
jgi:hypothetical protein